MNCKNCPDRKLCYSSPNEWNIADRKISSDMLVRILRCRNGLLRR
jgi:hypothetical protein